MAHEIDYGNLPANEKRQRALDDMSSWINNPDKLAQIKQKIAALPHTAESAKSMRFQFAVFAGVQGYPVVALLGESWNMTDDEVILLLAAGDYDGDELDF